MADTDTVKSTMLDPVSFAQGFRQLHPGAFDTVKDDYALAKGIVASHPEYQGMVDFGPQQAAHSSDLPQSTQTVANPPAAPVAPNGSKEWSTQHPALSAINSIAKPGQWFNENVVSPIARGIDNITGPLYEDNPANLVFSVSKTINDSAKYVSDYMDKVLTSGASNSIERWGAGVAQRAADAVPALNPIPSSTGEAVVGAAMMAGMSAPEEALHAVQLASPGNVESGFHSVAGYIKGADNAFLERDAAKAADLNVAHQQAILTDNEVNATNAKLTSDQQLATGMDIARDRDARARAAVNLSIQQRHGTAEMTNDWVDAQRSNLLTGSNNSLAQLPQDEVYRNIKASLAPENPYSASAQAKAPIVAASDALKAQLSDPKHAVRVSSVQNGLSEVKNDLMGLIGTPADTATRSLLAPYLDLPEWRNTHTPSTILGKSGEFTSDATTIPADKMYSDSQALGEMANRRLSSDPKASAALSKAQEILQQAITDKVPTDLGNDLIQNRRDYGQWYKIFQNDDIGSITIHDPKFSTGSDPIFDRPSTVNSYRRAVNPADWDFARKNKLNDVVGKILNSDDPKAALAQLKSDAPGFIESLTTDQKGNPLQSERTALDNIATTKSEANMATSDLKGLYDIRNNIDQQNRRSGDMGAREPRVRSTDSIVNTPQAPAQNGTIPDNSNRTQNVLMATANIGLLGYLAQQHPYIAGAIGSCEVAGFAPELLGRLYLKSPEVRSMILDAGAAQDHLGMISAAAKISTLLEKKQDEIHRYKSSVPPQALPPSLQKFDSSSNTPAWNNKDEPVELPADVMAEHFQPGYTGTPLEKPLEEPLEEPGE